MNPAQNKAEHSSQKSGRQLLGLFGGPAGSLLLPCDNEAQQETISKMATGEISGESTDSAQWQFYFKATKDDPEGALAALDQLEKNSGESSWLLKYNRFVLTADETIYEALKNWPQLDEEMTALLAAAAYLHGLSTTPAMGDQLTNSQSLSDNTRAYLFSTQAHYYLNDSQIQKGAAHLEKAAALAAPVFAARLHGELATIYSADPTLTAKAIENYQKAISLLEPTVFNELRAELALELGMTCQLQAAGDRSKLLAAINAYQQALLFYHKEGPVPYNYGLAHMNLALVYLAMPMNDEAERLRPAIAVQSLREALKVFDREQYPQMWASATLNLANALQHVPSTHSEDNLWEAVALYQDISTLRSLEQDPLSYARVLANQGNALAHLGAFSRAVPILEKALTIFEIHDVDSASAIKEILAEIASRRPEVGNL